MEIKYNCATGENPVIPRYHRTSCDSLFCWKILYYILNFDTYEIEYINPRVKLILGISAKYWTLDKAFELIHPEDLKQMHKKEAKGVDFILNKIPVDDILRYKVVYVVRFRHADGSYKTILQQTKTLTFRRW